MANKVKYTQKDTQIVNVLKANPDGLTLAEISEALGEKVQPGTVTGMIKKKLIEVIGEREVIKQGKRNHTLYVLVTAEPTHKEDGKENSYTDNEKAVLAAAQTIEGAFTLADLAVAMGRDKLSSGNTNGLIRKGNIAKTGEFRVVAAPTKDSVNVYGFLADVPADAEIQ